MSAYLMTTEETVLLAAYAAHHSLVPRLSAARAATTLRSANNAALAARYGDKPIPLKGVSALVDNPATAEAAQHTSPETIHRLACTFAYQCCEGDVWETHKGAALLRKIQQHAANAIHEGEKA